MPPLGFEPTISASERPLTYALDRAATGTGQRFLVNLNKKGRRHIHRVTSFYRLSTLI